eukprot:COSAG01_NODE_3077_length_6628_cov_82.115638_1_plen_170_part_00
MAIRRILQLYGRTYRYVGRAPSDLRCVRSDRRRAEQCARARAPPSRLYLCSRDSYGRRVLQTEPARSSHTGGAGCPWLAALHNQAGGEGADSKDGCPKLGHPSCVTARTRSTPPRPARAAGAGGGGGKSRLRPATRHRPHHRRRRRHRRAVPLVPPVWTGWWTWSVSAQ